MLTIGGRSGGKFCDGITRRGFLKVGGLAVGGLTLADLLRGKAQGAVNPGSPNKAIIMVYLNGGPSHMDLYDLKPDAPVEYRGEFKPIRTNVPGIQICEHLPRLARLADKFSLIRSCHHDSPGHVNSTHTLLTGYPGAAVETAPFKPKYPDIWAVVNKLLGDTSAGVPPYVAMPHPRYNGAAYLGDRYDPLTVAGDPNAAAFRVPNLSLTDGRRPQFGPRVGLLRQFDDFRRDLDTSGLAGSLDAFHQKAVNLLTSDSACTAFDLSRESDRLRDRYGRHAVGQRCLLARRLVEAGARVVTVDFPCVPGQKAFSWDDHASVWNIFEQMKIRLPVLDQVVSALVQDLCDRGLHKDVLLAVMGEMSHTPRINYFKGQPGREHWANSMSLFVAGGLKPGQVVGSTNHKGDEPRDQPVTPNDVLATWYTFLGIPLDTHFSDYSGRPTPILPHGRPIQVLLT